MGEKPMGKNNLKSWEKLSRIYFAIYDLKHSFECV
jgi:hypothetical protein